ncbi:MAG: helix-turn-helix domain-containing protein, partial [Sutterellaceae bacterium]|nr:helix-turn-helix domain-containing protein [Sutterellaceae bacterium]
MYEPKLPKDIRCPLEYALELFAGRWKSRILCMLYTNQTMRYGEIKKKLEGMTDTVLAATLRELLAAELVVRNQYAEIPPRVEYSLTEKAQSLVPLL